MRRIKILFWFLMFLWVSVANTIFAGEVEPVEVEAEGTYLMGDRDSRQDARQFALFEAKRNALEKAGTLLSSSTRIENFEVVKDEIYSQAAGRIQCEVTDEKWEHVGETMGVRLFIKAKVSPEDLRYETETSKSDSITDKDVAGVEKNLRKTKVDQKTIDPAEYFAMAQRLLHKGKNKEALKILNALEKRYPNAVRIQLLKAEALKREKLTGQAIQALAKACKLGSQEACQKVKQIHTEKTETDQRKSEPEQKKIESKKYFIQAQKLLGEGKNEEALKILSALEKRHPNAAQVQLLKAEALKREKRPGQAIKALVKACELGSQEACEKVKQMRKEKKD